MREPPDTITTTARAVWQGGLEGGGGRLVDGPAPDDGRLSWGRRTAGDTAAPATTPEQLIAAAHAGCFAMSLAAVLEDAGQTADRLDVEARCTAELGGAGLRIAGIDLLVTGSVPGLDADGFSRHAEQAERQCPVSNSLRGNVAVRVAAKLGGG